MNLHDLREAQANFTSEIDDVIERRKKLHQLRNTFTSDFNANKIAKMGIDDFVIGIADHNFCRRIERDLDGLGRIIGSTAFKFGVYYGRTKQDPEYIYRNSHIWGATPQIAYNNISPAIIKLIKDGKNEDIDAIIKSRISPMFKGKILSTYFPDRYLNVFSDEHLKYYLKSFDLDTKTSLKADPVIKREILLEFKNKDVVMKNWSVDIFSYFLYMVYPKRPIKNPKPIDEDVLKEYYNPDFPPNPIGSEVALNIVPFTASKPSEKASSKSSKPDYEKINRLNKKLGDRGEKVVLDFEIARLEKLGKFDLSKKVDRVSLISDSLGFDILSFEEDGTERYIEVKATRSKVGDANFFLSINELKTAQEKENYYVYLVYDILSIEPKIWIMGNPFNPENININIEPINFKVTVKVK
nr:DUF3883 domain-containing protein [uncultured Flavobacterium sp.]